VAYTADITPIVQAAGGNATYSITSILDRPVNDHDGEGVTILVIYEGNDGPERVIDVWSGLTFECTTTSIRRLARARLQFATDIFLPVAYLEGDAHFFLNALDGQLPGYDTFRMGHMSADGFPGTVAMTPPDAWQGLLGPGIPGATNLYYDHAEGDVTGYLESLDDAFAVETEAVSPSEDCIAHTLAAIAFEYNDPCDPVTPAGTDDCDDDGISDFCEIRDGTSCDSDFNGVPDECAACCDAGFCENRLPENCINPYVGTVCDGTYCTCQLAFCCVLEQCTTTGLFPIVDCACAVQGGHPVDGACTGGHCETGACCELDGHCTDERARTPCESGGGTYIGGGDCARDRETCALRRLCPVAVIDKSTAQPPDGVVDAGYPHEPSDAADLMGIGELHSARSVDTIIVMLNDGTPSNIDGAVDPRCWCLCETASDPSGGPNYVASVRERPYDMASTYEIVLARPITKGAVTTLSYIHDADYLTYISHPANVNGDSAANAVDILELIDCLNGADHAIHCPWYIYSKDADRSGQSNAADVLAVIDLLNGADAFDIWNNTPVPVNTACPGLCAQCGLGSGVSESVSSTATLSRSAKEAFTTALAQLLRAYAPTPSLAVSDFRRSVEALTKWCREHLSATDRGELIRLLSDPDGIYASPEGRGAADTILDVLRREP